MRNKPAYFFWRAASHLALALSSAASASAVTVAWDPNPETDIAGYHVYYAPLDGAAQKQTVQSTSAVINGLALGGVYSFYVTAFNTAGLESLPSSTLTYTNVAAVNLSWAQSRAFGVTGYRILYSTSGSPAATFDAGLVLSATLNVLPGQSYSYTVMAYNSLGLVVDTYPAVLSSSTQVVANPQASPNSAALLSVDPTTLGNWKGTYGSEGRQIVADSTVLPPWAAVTTTGSKQWVWNPLTTDMNVLKRTDGLGFLAACWYSFDSFDVNVSLTDGRSHIVSFYAVSYALATRAQRVDVIDSLTGVILSSYQLGSFSRGQYLSWEVSGSVTFRFTRVGDANAVVSGLFIDPVPTIPEAHFLGVDTTTGGNWKGTYGTSGYVVAADQASVPADVNVEVFNALSWTWSSNASSISALQKAILPGRVAACWYSPAGFTFRVNFDDENLHEVSLYCWDNAAADRSQRIEVVDPYTGTVLSSYNLANFTAGAYVSWNVKGLVDFRVINTGPWNAVVSGLFLDPAE